MKKLLFTLLGLILILGGIIALKATQIMSLIGFATATEEAGLPPSAVATATAREENWEESLRFVGTLRPVQGVMLTAEAAGILESINVENGASVEQDEILMVLESKVEQAELASARARLNLAKLNLDRASELLDKRIIARSEFDTAKAEFDADQARVENWQALIDRKVVRAPFSGRVGIRRVNLGQTIKPGDELIPIHQSDPIFVEFAVPQTRLSALKVGQKLRVLSDGLDEPVEGEITAINPVVDEATRTALVQGLLHNPQDRLRAGQFAQVDVILPRLHPVVAIPATALVSEAYGDSVFVIEEKDGKAVARQQFVQLGLRRGDFVEVTKGLSPGDRVVSAGAFKLTNGATVAPNDAMQPEASETPQPKNS
jgi:membrane fusion protein (multidrug efflux system)